jgi:hypothetical protein
VKYGNFIEWDGGPGQPVYYLQKDNSWRNIGAPEHGESAYYVSRALADPQVDRVVALNASAPELLNNEQRAFIAGGLVALDSFGQGHRWGYQNLSDNVFSPQQSGALLQTGFASYLSSADIAAGRQFNYDESPAQQSARDDSGDFLSDILPIVAIGAGMYFGAGALFGAAEAGAAGAIGAEAVGAATTAELGALGSGLAGVEVTGLGLYGQTELMAGALGSGLSGTSAASIGLTASAFTGAAAGAATVEASTTATQGVSTVEETILDWYSVDPGPDPFATTDMVNAGWSFDGGYPGVDWYNSAGVGEAAASNSLDSILGSINKVSSAVNLGIRALSGTAAQVRNNLATPAPNYTRAAGGINLGLLAVGLLAWKLL